jgi:histidinol phosphatase-like PHP family hydrolase
MSDHDRCGESPVEALSRRAFLKDTAIGIATTAALPCFASTGQQQDAKVDFPMVDYHVHLSGALTIDKAVELANTRGVKFGIVEHPGPGYKIVDDKALALYLDMLKKYPVYRGLQPVYPNSTKAFSRELLYRLDYILMDALTLPEKDGGWLRIWQPSTRVPDKQAFMDRYFDFNVRVLTEEPIDIFAWPTYLPSAISQDYDTLWTDERMQKIVDILVKKDIAIEINEIAKVPKARFINIAKNAGAKFTFGTDSRDERAGKFEYCLQMAKQCELSEKNMFKLKPDGQKAIQRMGKA